jgi:hypothetical protein
MACCRCCEKTGACCAGGGCTQETCADCEDLGGQFQGVDTECESGDCPCDPPADPDACEKCEDGESVGYCQEGRECCEGSCLTPPCQTYLVSGVATNCVGQTCTWGPREVDVSLVCGTSGLVVLTQQQVPASGCGPQADNDGAECWPCPQGVQNCDEPPTGRVSFGALINIYAQVECKCGYVTSAEFDSYVIVSETRWDSTTVEITLGECA